MSRRRAKSRAPESKPAATPPVEERRGGRVSLLLFVLLSAVGLGVAIDLTSIHVWVHTDPTYRSFCALSEAVNCDTVAESSYSVLFGVPVSGWGMLGYLLLGGVALAGMLRRRAGSWPAGTLLVLTLGAALASLALGAISALAIHSICILCLCTYGINAALLVLAVLLVRGRGGLRAVLASELESVRARPRPWLAGLVPVVVAAAVLIVSYPHYWEKHTSPGPGGLTTGFTADGKPWIGAAEPRLTIVEYSDYLCPHCRRGHMEMRELVTAHPEEIRFVHRHFPLDQACNPLVRRPYHPRACEMARMMVCAGKQHKAWEANDLLFSQGNGEPLSREGFVRQLGLDGARFDACLSDPASLAEVKSDIDAGLALGIRGTPTYAVGGKTYPGHIPPEEIEKLIAGKAGAAP